MDPSIIVCIIFPIAAAAMIALAVYAYKQAAARRQAMLELAKRLGLSFDESRQSNWDRNWPQFERFKRGHSRCAFNLLSGALRDAEGEAGHELGRCILGDYEFKETHSNGKSTTTVTYRFGFLIVTTRWRDMPDMLVRREHFFDKLAGVLGFDDIDFESAEFSRKFMVKCKDKRFAYDLIDPRMMEFLLGSNTPCIDIGGDSLCLWYGQTKRLKPEELESLYKWSADFLRRWPRVTVARLDGANSTG